MIKRLIDILLASIFLLLLLPFILLIWLILKAMVQGAVLIKQKRVGKKEKPITLYRFKLPAPVSDVAIEKQRVQKFARLLRMCRVDGWPLLVNVVKGDMSLVGPASEDPKFVQHYSDEQRKIFRVRPGIVGPYFVEIDKEVNGQFSKPEEWEEYYRENILPRKLRVELQYVKNSFLGRDVKVFLDRIWQKIGHFINEQLMQEAKNRNFFLPLDVALIIVSYFFAYQLRFDWSVPQNEYSLFFKSLPLILFIRVVTFYTVGLYKNLWKYVGVRDLVSIISAVSISSILSVAIIYLIGISTHSRSVFLIDWLLCISFIGGSRLILRMFNESISYEKKLRRNVLIIGAGDVGEMLLRELEKNGRNEYEVIGFIDDDEGMHGRTIHGRKVLGACEDIPEIVQLLRIDEALITVNQFSSDQMKAIVKHCKEADVRHRMVPAVSDLLSGTVHLSKFRKVEISDLFGRQPVELDLSAISSFIGGKRIMVTGAGGSIGSELCRQIVEYQPASMILVDKNENYLHEIHCELDVFSVDCEVRCCLNDITNQEKQRKIFEEHRPQIVFHAAAQKHVPLSEDNPEEAVTNNILGTKIISDLAAEFKVDRFVMVSTDKAVNPTSIMGVTKRVAELYIQGLAQKSQTKFVTVRFGNVLNSNGSVVPTFMKQIERGGPVTVTHPSVERYFMSIAEAVQLILQAATMGNTSEIYILNMGKSIRIVDLAAELIKQSGMKPDEDIKIKFTGLRPGEKLFEELIGQNEELLPTSHTGIKTLKNMTPIDPATVEAKLDELLKVNALFCVEKIRGKLKDIVPEYDRDRGDIAPPVGVEAPKSSRSANGASASSVSRLPVSE